MSFSTFDSTNDTVLSLSVSHSIPPSYLTPWSSPKLSNSTSTGIIIECPLTKEKIVLTNQHCIQDSQYISACFSGDDQPFDLEVVRSDFNCDLALLKFKEKDRFYDRAIPFYFNFSEDAPLLPNGSEVTVAGFPNGAKECTITAGVIASSTVCSYSNMKNAIPLLRTSINVTANPGNSGGPVFSQNNEGKISLEGVVFQKDSINSGLNHMIPRSIILHFLISPAGFPWISFDFQDMNNPLLRQKFGLKSETETGIRIKHVPKFSQVKSFLKEDDILIKVDEYSVSNTGKVQHPDLSDRISYSYIVTKKRISQAVTFTVLRDKKEITFDVALQNNDSKQCNFLKYEIEKYPEYFIIAGLIMQPLTSNLIFALNEFFTAQNDSAGYPRYLEFYLSKEKEELKEKVFVVNRLLVQNETSQLPYLNYKRIISVNGMPIKTTRDLIMAFYNNSRETYEIDVSDDDKIILPNQPEFNEKCLKKYLPTAKSGSDRFFKKIVKHAILPDLENNKEENKESLKINNV